MQQTYFKNLANKMQKLSLIVGLSLFVSIGQSQKCVVVTSTTGKAIDTMPTLSRAFDSINKAVFKGSIIITVIANTAEPSVPTPLWFSGFVSGLTNSSYTSIYIRPQGNVTLSCASINNGRALCELNGADNVTIDGDDPLTPGIKNLTIQNAIIGSPNASVIRIGSTFGPNDSCANIIVKNCIIKGNRQSALNTLETSGIHIGSNIATNPLTSDQGFSSTNIVIENNTILRCFYGISIVANTNAKPFTNIKILKDSIGVTNTVADFVGSIGIYLARASTTASPSLIEGCTIKAGYNSNAGFDAHAIGILCDWGNAGLKIQKNYIQDIQNYTTNNTTAADNFGLATTLGGQFGVYGILLWGDANSTGIDINNNIIRDVIAAKKTSSTFLHAGIFNFVSTNAKIVNNTIALNTVSTQGTQVNPLSVGVVFSGSTVEYSGNIVKNMNVSTAALCVYTQTNSFSTASVENNCYYAPSGAIGGNFGTFYPTLDAFQIATNKDLTSFIENPKFISATDLHIQPGVVTKLEGNATTCILIQDIDNDLRPFSSPLPDIGADEFNGIKYIKPIIKNVSSVLSQGCSSTARTITALVDSGNALDSVMIEYTINGGSMVRKKMGSAAANIFNFIIPAVAPPQAIVQYRVFVVTKVGDTISSNPFYYNDNTIVWKMDPTLTANPNQACVGSTVQFSYSYPQDPTGFNDPPAITNATNFFDITQVTMNTIDNTSPINSLTGSMGVATGTAGVYSNFRSVITDTVKLGKSYKLALSATTSGGGKCYFAGYVDFNGDGDFTDAGENVLNTFKQWNVGSISDTFNLYIHPGARPGKTCLRIITSTRPIADPLSTLPFGEVEDYSIYIRPHAVTNWQIGGVPKGNANPLTHTITALPTTYFLELTDQNVSATSCLGATPAGSVTQSPAAMTSCVFTGPVGNASCYNTLTTVSVALTGGCPPYTYAWSNSSSNTNTNSFVLAASSLTITVTVTDKNGLTKLGTYNVNQVNPLPLTIDTPKLVCNYGEAIVSGTTVATDSLYWYRASAVPNYTPTGVGNVYTTQTIYKDDSIFYAAFRSISDFTGKPNNAGTPGTSTQLKSGLTFKIIEPIIIKSCEVYGVGTNASMNIGVLDKYGTLLASTGMQPVTFAVAPNPTTIPLNFNMLNVDTGFRLVLLGTIGVTSLDIVTAGHSYPYFNGKSMIVTGTYSMFTPASTSYFYFYNINYLRGICVGKKQKLNLYVQPPRVPYIDSDMVYTQVCKGSNFTYKLDMNKMLKRLSKADTLYQDTFATDFYWYQDDSLKWYSNSPTFTMNNLTSADTGQYRIEIKSTKYCTKDTFSRTARLSFWPQAFIQKDTSITTNACKGYEAKMKVKTKNAYYTKWFKNSYSSLYKIDSVYYPDSNMLIINQSDYPDAAYYYITVQDKNLCKPDSFLRKLNIFDIPKFTLEPEDSIVCENAKHIIKAQAINTVKYQWYKDGGIDTGFIKDNITIYNAKISDSGLYRLKISSFPGCPDSLSKTAHLTVNPVPKILGLYETDLKYCENQKIQIPAYAKDHSSILWYKSPSTPEVVVSDTLKRNVATISDAGTYYFEVLPLNKCNSTISKNFNITVFKKALVSGFKPDTLVCTGTEIKYNYNSTDGKTFQWYKNDAQLQGATDSVLNLKYISIKDTGYYSVKVNSNVICDEVSSNKFKLNVVQGSSILSKPKGDTVCNGLNVVLAAIAKNALSYQWRRDNAIVPAPGGISSTLNLNNINVNQTGSYVLEIKGNTPCKSIYTDTVKVALRSGATNAFLSTVSQYDAVESCTDAQSWTYYSPQGMPERFIFAVRKRGNAIAGKADVVVRPSTFINVNSTGKEYTISLLMKRFWNYKNDGQSFITSPIDVKFYYDVNELDELDKKKSDIQTLYSNDNLKTENNFVRWFYTDSTLPFTNASFNSIKGNKFGFPTLDIADYIKGSENGISYIIFNNVTDFGGGTAGYTFKGGPKVLTSIKDVNSNLNVEVYPNPSNGEFNLNVETSSLGKLSVSIINELGQNVFSNEYDLKNQISEIPISLPSLAKGIYHMVINKDSHLQSVKLQIEK